MTRGNTWHTLDAVSEECWLWVWWYTSVGTLRGSLSPVPVPVGSVLSRDEGQSR